MAALWLTAEAGEVATEVRRWIAVADDPVTTHQRLEDELGDLLWCVAEVATLARIRLVDAAERQRIKQEARYAECIRLHDTEGK